MINQKKKYFSYSQISTFSNCSLKYKFIYIDKIKNKSEGIESFIGKRVHETLEWLYIEISQNKEIFLSFDKIEDKFLSIWNEKWHHDIYVAILFKINEEMFDINYYQRIGIEHLRRFYNNNNNNGFFYNNTQKIEVEKKIEINFENFIIRGIIDRIDYYEDKIEIHDYKTGKIEDIKKIKRNLQAYIYYIYAHNKFPEKEIILNWHYLKEKNKSCQMKTFSLNEIDKEKIRKQISLKLVKINHSIRKKQFFAKPNILCKWCYFWEECDAYDTNYKNEESVRLK